MKQKARTVFMLIGILSGIIAVFQPAPAFGYVLPAPFILEQTTAGMGLPHQFQVEQDVRILARQADYRSDEKTAGVFQYRQVLKYSLPGLFRADISGEGLNHSHVSTPRENVTILDGVLLPASEEWLYDYKKLFSHQSGFGLMESLEKSGVDITVSSLGRLDRTICYVIGARYPDVTVPQVWVDKENFRPVRLVIVGARDSRGKPAAEIRFSNWREFGEMRYPTTIHLIENGRRVQTITVGHVNPSPVFSADLFDIDSLERAGDDTGEKELDISDEIRKTLEEFKSIYE